jgi:hypothetical protein
MLKTYLTGEFDRVLIQVPGESLVIDEDSGLSLPPKNVTELDLVSYLVRTIERDC